MADLNSDLPSKITRAIRALLISEGAGSAVDTFAAPCGEPRALPNTTIHSGDADPFDGPGNWSFSVMLILRDEAVTQSTKPNPVAQRVAANQRFTNISNTLTRSDDTHTLKYTALAIQNAGRALAVSDGSAEGDKRAADNADMADFSVLWWEKSGFGSAKQASPGAFWERDLNFTCVACNAAIN